jgi:hypothetical protein
LGGAVGVALGGVVGTAAAGGCSAACASHAPPTTWQIIACIPPVTCVATEGVTAASPAASAMTPAITASHSTDACPRSRMPGSLAPRTLPDHGSRGSSSRLGRPRPRGSVP